MAAHPPTLRPLVGSATGNGAALRTGERGSSSLREPVAVSRFVDVLNPTARVPEAAAATAAAASARLPALSERELVEAYSGGTPDPYPVQEPCACGEVIVCTSDDIPLGVMAHLAGRAHRRWRAAGGLQAPSFDVRVVERGTPIG